MILFKTINLIQFFKTPFLCLLKLAEADLFVNILDNLESASRVVLMLWAWILGTISSRQI